MQGVLDATTQTLAWSAVFFLASAAASSAYLTVSEVFPLEMRAISISIFYAVGTGVGGFAAPALFGALIETGDRVSVFHGLRGGRGAGARGRRHRLALRRSMPNASRWRKSPRRWEPKAATRLEPGRDG